MADQAPNTNCAPLVCDKLKAGTIYIINSFQSLDVALGLEYLHGKGIIHGDLKVVRLRVSLAS